MRSTKHKQTGVYSKILSVTRPKSKYPWLRREELDHIVNEMEEHMNKPISGTMGKLNNNIDFFQYILRHISTLLRNPK